MLPTERFSGRAHNYSNYRPDYPDTLLRFFQEKFRLNQESKVADIGSGTGILSAQLLQKGYQVFGVEPNADMRQKAEEALGSHAGFVSITGTGEQTNLPDHSVNLVTVAQAFHWMDPATAKKEFHRILTPGGHIAILWNLHAQDSLFGQGYEALRSHYGMDYKKIRKSHEPDLASFFAPATMEVVVFSHHIFLDLQGFQGQIQSSSFMPQPGHPQFEEMMEKAEQLFTTYQENGLVKIAYNTKLYYGS
ncbi:MAG: class I SAM-dependent methyltransferase [Candidatus Pseudobacter hemicellulosilyticus]|uniref:Class I SAM-dependent methyltransferase n=1 Tax=Candidatus Pseudobacter hemicellulosilyticus TaxID=3121375 RepID=A0AAJ5WVF3_9BACT|nr:MAG: class I SAM-dependent methyltransferase [Pseudobacter sp.]